MTHFAQWSQRANPRHRQSFSYDCIITMTNIAFRKTAKVFIGASPVRYIGADITHEFDDATRANLYGG